MSYILNVMLDEGFQRKLLNDDGTLNENALAELARLIGENTNDIANLRQKKVNVAQGVSNAGKYLVVDAKGNVSLATLNIPTPPTYGIAEVATTEGYLKTYQLYSVADGKTTYHDTKINIPRDFFLRNVELLDVTETSPLAGYEVGKYFKFTFVVDGGAERIQILPIDTLRPCPLTAGDHIHIEGEVAEAHSFVPEYDDITKVLGHEKIIHWKGETSDKFVHGYFYERGEGGVIPAGSETWELEFKYNNRDWAEQYPFLAGKWYDTGRKGTPFYVYYGQSIGISTHRITEVGDTILTSWGVCEVVAVNEDELTIKIPSGTILNTKFTLHDVRESSIFTNGERIVHVCKAHTDEQYSGTHDLVYFPNEEFVFDGGSLSYIDRYMNTWRTMTLDHDIKYGSTDWHQLNVQPSSTPYDPTALIQRIENLEADSHAQNTDTQLKDGMLYIDATTRNIHVKSGVYVASDVVGTNGQHRLSGKLNSSMQRTYATTEDLIADMANIPEGAWCAIINTHSAGVSAQSDDDIIE